MAAIAEAAPAQAESVPTADFYQISDEFAIDGKLSAEQLTFLCSRYASALYLCTDTPTDSG
jgi:hypothetical protein